MRRRTWKDAAALMVAAMAGTAAALIATWGAMLEFPSALAWLPDTTLAAQAVPAYTNDDLERIRPLRGETGVTSQPAFSHGVGACRLGGGRGRGRRRATADACGTDADTRSDVGAARSEHGPAAHDEAYWRHEADRVRDKLRAWRQQVEDLELKIAERRRKPGVRPYTDPQIVAAERRADALRARMRELEGDLDDRARRERALPGWLR